MQGGSHADLRLPNEKGNSAFFDGTREACIVGIIFFAVIGMFVIPVLPDGVSGALAFSANALVSLCVIAITARFIGRRRAKQRALAEEEYRAMREFETQKGIDRMRRDQSNNPEVRE